MLGGSDIEKPLLVSAYGVEIEFLKQSPGRKCILSAELGEFNPASER
jgi:hypothetical protein